MNDMKKRKKGFLEELLTITVSVAAIYLFIAICVSLSISIAKAEVFYYSVSSGDYGASIHIPNGSDDTTWPKWDFDHEQSAVIAEYDNIADTFTLKGTVYGGNPGHEQIWNIDALYANCYSDDFYIVACNSDSVIFVLSPTNPSANALTVAAKGKVNSSGHSIEIEVYDNRGEGWIDYYNRDFDTFMTLSPYTPITLPDSAPYIEELESMVNALTIANTMLQVGINDLQNKSSVCSSELTFYQGTYEKLWDDCHAPAWYDVSRSPWFDHWAASAYTSKGLWEAVYGVKFPWDIEKVIRKRSLD